jgi:hypothetical protein
MIQDLMTAETQGYVKDEHKVEITIDYLNSFLCKGR